MEAVKPEPVAGVWPTVNPSVNGGASGMLTTGVFQPVDTTKFFSDVNQVPTTENLQVSQNTFEKIPRGDKWNFEEDMTLMSAWCVASEHQLHNKKQKNAPLWSQVKRLYDEAQAENSKKLGSRNKAQMKGRWKRLNESANKWIDAYRKAYRQKTNEMSLKDIENEAHKNYAAIAGSMYNDIVVFNEVMCKHPKWELLNDRVTTPSLQEHEVLNDESGGITKRTMITEDGEYCVLSNPETPNNDGLTDHHAYRKKEKHKLSQFVSFRNEYVAELRAMRITRDTEIEFMRKRLELEQRKEGRKLKKEERKLKKEERKNKKVYHMHLNTLLAKEHLSPENEDMKRHLLAMLYGK